MQMLLELNKIPLQHLHLRCLLHNSQFQRWLEVVAVLAAVNSCSTGTVFVSMKQCKVKVSNLIFCFHQTHTIPPSLVKPYGNSTW